MRHLDRDNLLAIIELAKCKPDAFAFASDAHGSIAQAELVQELGGIGPDG